MTTIYSKHSFGLCGQNGVLGGETGVGM
jgi:hypothetical protein